MQSLKKLAQWLAHYANEKHYLFLFNDLRSICDTHTHQAFKTLLSRAVASGLLMRVCRGVYLYQKAQVSDGLLLFHVAALLRGDHFNYISLETALSDAGVISQMPMNWITILTSGRSGKIHCGNFGTIEFIHTRQSAAELMEHITYDQPCGLWRANVSLAIRDMRVTRRNMDLIDWNLANELIR